jgi:hypothetical protein
MKETNNTGRFTDREWEELAAQLSGERIGNGEVLSRFAEEDQYNTVKSWKDLREMDNESEIDVDRAWNRLFSRLSHDGLMGEEPEVRTRFLTPAIYRYQHYASSS